MTRRSAILLLTPATLLLAASESDTTVSVAVTGPSGKPVPNATVIIDFLGSHQVTKLGRRHRTHWEAKTNEQGVAKFPPVPQGKLQVQVVAEHLQTFGDHFNVDTPEKTIPVKLSKPQSQYSQDAQK